MMDHFMPVQDKVVICVQIAHQYRLKAGKWPSPITLVDYAVETFKVKRDTATSYVKEAVTSGYLSDGNGRLEITAKGYEKTRLEEIK